MKPIQDTDLVDYLSGELSPERTLAVERAVAIDEELAAELVELREILSLIEGLPDPLPGPDTDQAINEAVELRSGGSNLTLASSGFKRQSLYRYAAAAAIVLAVFGIGWYFGGTTDRQVGQELAATRSLMLELMREDRPSSRVRAATVALDLPIADPVIIDNLGYLLRNDEDNNVRLAALDALLRFADSPMVRQQLLDAMGDDPPPVMRIQLMESLVRLGEQRVLPYLEEMIRTDTLPQQLRDAAQLGTFKLI